MPLFFFGVAFGGSIVGIGGEYWVPASTVTFVERLSDADKVLFRVMEQLSGDVGGGLCDVNAAGGGGLMYDRGDRL